MQKKVSLCPEPKRRQLRLLAADLAMVNAKQRRLDDGYLWCVKRLDQLPVGVGSFTLWNLFCKSHTLTPYVENEHLSDSAPIALP